MTDSLTGYRDSSPITKILDRLYLGNFSNAEALRKSNPHGITCIVNCTAEPLELPKKFKVIQMDQQDGHEWNAPKVYSTIEWIRGHLLAGRTVLVHCHAGISRSPVLVAAYLYTCGFDFIAALDQIKRLRPIVQPAPAILASMKRAFGITPVAHKL